MRKYRTPYMREYRSSKKNGSLQGVTGSLRKVSTGSLQAVRPTLDELRELMKSTEEKVVRPPLYNPSIHGPGDRVLVQQGKRLIETIIPELDASGNPIPDM